LVLLIPKVATRLNQRVGILPFANLGNLTLVAPLVYGQVTPEIADLSSWFFRAPAFCARLLARIEACGAQSLGLHWSTNNV
jgi:hypothetical protein